MHTYPASDDSPQTIDDELGAPAGADTRTSFDDFATAMPMPPPVPAPEPGTRATRKRTGARKSTGRKTAGRKTAGRKAK
ncbi:MAG TPA: hypothetical protein VFW74_09725, partial [Acidimicrobiia bacterium]|nr:hypothetical protein [Acidimicrobiia bacterium]